MPALHLVRHGDAMPTQADGERPLTVRGRADAARLAEWCAANGVAPHAIHHSGILRAAQTAEILAARLAPPGGVRAVRGLAPDDEPEPLAAGLAYETEPLLLVTHMPFVGELASVLVTGRTGAPVVHFATATIACLEPTPGGFRVAATWSPS